MRSTAGKISYRLKIPAFTDDRRIYTLVRLENLEIDKAFRLSYEAEEKLDIQKNKKIYADVVRYYINEKLKTSKIILGAKEYSKYKIGNDITTVWIEEIKDRLSSNDKKFRVRRKYDFQIKIADDNKLQLDRKINDKFLSSHCGSVVNKPD